MRIFDRCCKEYDKATSKKQFLIIIVIGALMLTSPALHAQDFLQKAKKFLDAGECEKAKLAYEAYKVENPGGDAGVEQRMDECWKKFDGQPCPGTPTVTDYDGHTYNTVRIGKQCWMKENLRTKHYANGTEISFSDLDTSTTIGYYSWPNHNIGLVEKYGYLYNWKALMGNSSSSNANPSGVQGICPAGWHVPSKAEWIQLDEYVSSQSKYVCGSDNKNKAKALASVSSQWSLYDTLKTWKDWAGKWEVESHYKGAVGNCDVISNQGINNETGFSALPAGSFDPYPYRRYYSFGYSADFWSTTESSNYPTTNAFSYGFCSLSSSIFIGFYGLKIDYISVRCVRD